MNLFPIKNPWLTEKASVIRETGQYVFIVQSDSTKNEIKKAVKELYKVDPTSVNIVNTQGKRKRFRNLWSSRSGFKKAIVTLKPGQKINIGQ